MSHILSTKIDRKVLQIESGTRNVLKEERNSVFVTTGSLSNVFNLPDGVPGLEYTFVKNGVGELTINPKSGARIADGDLGEPVLNDSSDQDYATITLSCVFEESWVISGAHGTWKVGS